MRPLQHDPSLGEVDPRTYPLLFRVKLGCSTVGSHERLIQISRLQRLVDKACTDEGDNKVRVHFTADPQVDAKVSVEVRLQPLAVSETDEPGFVKRVAAKLKADPAINSPQDWTIAWVE